MSEHIVPVRVYIAVFLVLLAGTALTVAAAFYDFPWQLNTIVALTIATAKATFVVLYFMHVRYSVRLVWVIVASALFWMAIMFALTFSDYRTRKWDGRLGMIYSPGCSVVSRTSIMRRQDGQFKRIVASDVLIGASQKGQAPLISL
ncbi:MAG TPA: cytochrome C oxidase subunit IV family protein [Pyrinomonadaceae bacterium]